MKGEALEQARITALMDELLEEFALYWMHVVYKFSTKTDGDRVAATTMTDWEYRQASIEFCLPVTILETDLGLRRICVHELVHVLAAPMEMQVKDKPLPNKLCELAVENLTRAFLEVMS